MRIARLGRGFAVRSLYLHSLRAAYGLGRSAKAKIFPWLVAGLVLIVAVVVAAVRAATGELLMDYPAFSDNMVILVVLFVAVVAPELVSRDLRSGVLALYFSRPIRRGDYAWGNGAQGESWPLGRIAGAGRRLKRAASEAQYPSFCPKSELSSLFVRSICVCGIGRRTWYALMFGAASMLWRVMFSTSLPKRFRSNQR